MSQRNFISPGIILRSRPSGEKNRRLEILTPQRGIVTATAYGAASQKSTLRSAVQSFHAGEMFFYTDPVKGYTKLRDIDLQFDFPGIRMDSKRLYGASLMAEILLVSSASGGEDPQTYRLTFEFLEAMDNCPAPSVARLCVLGMWRYLEIMGLAPDLEYDADSGRPLPSGAPVFYRFDEGGFSGRQAGVDQAFLKAGEMAFLKNQGRRRLVENLGVSMSDQGSDLRLFSFMSRLYQYQLQRRLYSLDAGVLP